MRLFALIALAGLATAMMRSAIAQDSITPPSAIEVSARGIERPLAPPGDARRGRALLLARDPANCILCHGLKEPAVRFSGNIAPPLDGAGSRHTEAQLRLRVADSSRLNPETIMPAYYKIDGLRNVASVHQGKPVLSAQQVEDLVVYLSSLR